MCAGLGLDARSARVEIDGRARFRQSDFRLPAHIHRYVPGMFPKSKQGGSSMKKYVCTVCGYVYEGDELPEDYECPLCGVGPDQFEEA